MKTNYMNNKFKNLLAEKPTNWSIWYAIFPIVGFILPSIILNTLGNDSIIFTYISSILQFLLLGVTSLGLVWLFSKRKPTISDLGFDTKPLTKINLTIVLSVFIITHLAFYLFGKIGTNTNIEAEFLEIGFGNGLFSDLTLIIAGTIFAPLFEELVYRGVMLRSIHDGLLHIFPKSISVVGIPALVSIVFTAIAFILPHVSNISFNLLIVGYFLTSAGFSIVYITTRSMIAAMVSHSLQSCVAYSTILIYGHGNLDVSPIIYIISFSCPIIVYFAGKCIRYIMYGNLTTNNT